MEQPIKHLGVFQQETIDEVKIIALTELNEGINDKGNFIINVSEGKVVYAIDKVCDHAGGRLIVKGEDAVCPMHNWKLNLKTLKYSDSHVVKKQKEFSVSEGSLTLHDKKFWLTNPFLNSAADEEIKFRWLNHATVHFSFMGKTLVTDPWLFGPAFMTGWWLNETSPVDFIKLIQEADYIFISHNHPDHLHPETLSCISKDKRILVGNFNTKSCENYLHKLGFTNVIPLEFSNLYSLFQDFNVSILKSGDFRDDSGIYIQAGKNQFVLTVDCNFLNHHNLPKPVDVLMTSFAGGATGFPLCFDDYDSSQRLAIMTRNRGSIKANVQKHIEATKPSYYMPYAGMFKEYAERDAFIRTNNFKNSPADYENICTQSGVEILKPDMNCNFTLRNGRVSLDFESRERMERESFNYYIENLKKEYPFNAENVINYLRKSAYVSNQILQLVPTNDSFDPLGTIAVYADFAKSEFREIDMDDLLTEKEGYRVTTIRIRAEVLMCITENYLPWEDFSIGFQMRIKRSPNVYESDLWYHFTNVYIAKENFRYSSYCGSCTVIDQNPIWSNIESMQGQLMNR